MIIAGKFALLSVIV